MTEVAVGGLESAAEPKPDAHRIPCFDGFRAAAALSVLLLHVAGSSGATQRSRALGPYLARLDVGVAVFFLIAGFLLYRPFVAAHISGGRAPASLPFFRRRFLRIYPAYWVATTAVVYVFHTWPGGSTIEDAKSFVLYYSLAYSYNLGTIFAPLLQAWTLATEVAFYVFLPAWAWLMWRAAARATPASFFSLLPGIFGPQDRGAIRRLLRSRVVQALGVVSYGIYLWHENWIEKFLDWRGIAPFSGDFWPMLGAVLGLTIVSAAVSDAFVERPALRLKRRLGPRPVTQDR
jgi:peptidoglycan/LPS O-acetylase OafA/YrhL